MENIKKLESWQIAHNRMLDAQIELADHQNKRREQIHLERMAEWKEYRENELRKNPNKWIPQSYPGMDMSPRKIVIGIRYV